MHSLTKHALLLGVLLVPGWTGAQDGGIERLRQTGKAFSSVAKRAAPGVVFVQVEGRAERGDVQQEVWPFHDDLFRRFFGDEFPGLGRPAPKNQRRTIGQGSGFVFAADGDMTYIVTNNHVVANAERVRVKFQDGRELDARLQGADPKSDVAVLKVAARGLPALNWGDSSRLDVGEWVVALGNPFGLSNTLTTGVVSAKGRTSLGINDYEDFIQTDAAINPGNSGGPLLNLDSGVVGMNTAIFSKSGGYMGVGFAIPSNLVRAIAEQLATTGQVVRGYIGLTVQPLTPDMAEVLGLPEQHGVLVSQVNPDSPAEGAGLRVGDLITSFDGVQLTDGGHFRNRAALAVPGASVTLGLVRDGRRLDVPVRVGRLNEEGLQGPQAAQALGVSVRGLSPREARRLGLSKVVVVIAVEPQSVADLAGISPGTLVLEVNGRTVGSPAEFAAALAEGRDGVALRILDGGPSRSLSLRWR
jgi:serine protease Do